MATLTLSFKGTDLKVFSFADGEVVVGRDPECDVFIDSLAIEPRHARISIGSDSTSIFDESGRESVFINGNPVNDRLLIEGDEIYIGKHTLRYSAETLPEEEENENEESAEEESTTAPVIDEPEPTPPAPVAEPESAPLGWLQIMSGKQFGKSMALKQGITRVGIPGKQTAAIAHRNGGYYLSMLEGDTAPMVNGISIGESSHELKDGETITIGETKLQFYLEKQ
ncbi:hypothetical protein BOW53_05090 [Solemya pervernicosa gill symbiont]|uniref:FHA domain-containing protein n=2 Tax=Gammaproteobacteria incertae sedis TaxID=118884 RepID=A0A1T2L834_9GAMM|nr:FHA domain-containing protein [Candidatus Reidiella endopervernicosa]OOZ41106.1 hypothetical protein BOW53_05090 [Solemya pervernicosa gill symbiont]QKQ26270.1 FHA domain-containing protein [Candidatus Reidiella endopervernicosa]